MIGDHGMAHDQIFTSQVCEFFLQISPQQNRLKNEKIGVFSIHFPFSSWRLWFSGLQIHLDNLYITREHDIVQRLGRTRKHGFP